MDSLIETFHIDIKLLIAQAINFGVIFLLLYFFALKPLTKTMQERTRRIENSLTDAKKIEEKMQKIDQDYEKSLNQAKKEANEIIAKAAKQAETKRENMLKRAKDEIGAVIDAEKEKINKEKEAVLKEIKADMAGLIVASVEKVLEKKIDAKEDKKLIEKSINA